MGAKLRLATSAALGAGAIVAARKLREARRWSFLGRSVVITGGTRGLGLVMARMLADEGAQVTILARDEDEVRRAEDEFRAKNCDVLAFSADIRDEEQATAAIERAVAHWGRIDALINNAGVISVGPIEHQTLDDFKLALDTHVWGPLYTMRAALPHMRNQGSGRIVNIASIGGKVAVPHLVPYSTSKFALVGLSDGMRAELAKDNIRVTTVSPGLMRTGSPPNVLVKGQHEKEYSWFAISDANPLASISVERAARQIIEACRYGDPALTISTQARVLEVLNNLFPSLIANIMAIGGRLLPGPDGEAGDQQKTGWESQSPLAPSVLTELSDKETVQNNELQGRSPSAIDQEREVNAS